MLRRSRALVGYLPRDQGVNLLVQAAAAEGTPDHEAAGAVWEQAVSRVQARPTVDLRDPILPFPNSLMEMSKSFADRPDLQRTFAQHSWSIEFADLTRAILSYQLVVQTDDALDRVGELDAEDMEGIFRFCLPDQETMPIQGGFDPTQNAFTASSLNPNLRVAGFQVAASPNGSSNIIGFNLSLGSNQIQLVEYRGRWMVRDGYHRLYGLLARGITAVPCILIRARSFEETGAGRPGFFSYETLFGDRPPLLSDFLSQDYSVETWTQAVRKIVRIRAEEFVVPI